jgi:hypothetical protein
VLLPRGWLFTGLNPIEPLSTRQLNRAVHAAAEAAGIKKRVSGSVRSKSFRSTRRDFPSAWSSISRINGNRTSNCFTDRGRSGKATRS